MALIALLEFRLDPAALDVADEIIRETLRVTRAFDGCEDLQVLREAGDPTRVVVYERWESAEKDAAYRAFRASPEGASRLREVVAAPPTLTMYELFEV
ncbi:putative quinol monooxygenase [Kineococcus gynurae]|uniref:Quinol monooxygenase n=1 Tax=Kineococcus gynurae TaxID=452979 RepID=A0ABV5LVA4_9ACTN